MVDTGRALKVMNLNSYWDWLRWGTDVFRAVQPWAIVGTFIATIWTVWNMLRGWRVVRIIAVETDTMERKHIADLPWQFATRAEVQGLVANAARGERLDFGQFQFDYAFRKELIVRLPQESFRKLRSV
jgi:hypothetical protein